MTATNHVLAGSLIALIVKKPELAIPLAFASHFIMDIIPHYAPRELDSKLTRNLATLDGLIAIVTTISIALMSATVPGWLILACAVAAIGPDLIWAWRYIRIRDMNRIFKQPISKFSLWHLHIQHESQQGVVSEVVAFIVMITLVFIQL